VGVEQESGLPWRLNTTSSPAAILEPTLARWMAPGFAQRNPEGLQHLQHMMRNTPQEGFLSCAAALRDADIAPLVQNLPAHTLLIAGEHDAAVTGMLRELKARRPEVGWIEVPGAGHLPNLEQPEAFNRALVEFLL
jgi:3-oxoadipate enol-lactonase